MEKRIIEVAECTHGKYICDRFRRRKGFRFSDFDVILLQLKALFFDWIDRIVISWIFIKKWKALSTEQFRSQIFQFRKNTNLITPLNNLINLLSSDRIHMYHRVRDVWIAIGCAIIEFPIDFTNYSCSNSVALILFVLFLVWCFSH